MRTRKPKPGRVQARARDRPQGAELVVRDARSFSRTAAEAAGNETVYAAVTKIANALAMMPVHLYRGTERLADDPRDRLVSYRPNPRQTPYGFKQALELQRNIEGRAYAVKRYDETGNLSALEVLDAARVVPYAAEETGDIYYRVTRPDGRAEWLHNFFVLAFFHSSTDGLTGIRVADVLKGSLEYNESVKRFSLDSLKAVNRGIVLEYPTTFAGPKRKNSMQEFLELYRASGGQVIALEAGVKASTLTMSPIDSSAFDVEKTTRSRVAMVYNMAPYMLGDTSSGAPATAEEKTLEFLSMTMAPIVQQYEEQLNQKLLLPGEWEQGYEFRIDVDAYLRMSPGAMAQIQQSRVRCGLRTVNEIRRAEHLDDVEGGNEPMISKDLCPVKLVARGATLDADAINGEHNAAKAGKDNT